MNINERLNFILKKHGWSRYRLAKESGLPESTITNIFHRGTIPTISTLESICKTMNISLAEFFTDGELVEMTPELKKFYDEWICLSEDKKLHIIQTMRYMK